jgi:Spy/CpxP family protein refolding chaperone
MIRPLALAGAAFMAVTVSACATQPHTDATMLSGSHPMAPKAGSMSDRVMPWRSSDCTKSALAAMPPEHRKLCEAQSQPHNP